MNEIDYFIKLRNHWWFDAGIAGFYDIARMLCQKSDSVWKQDVLLEPDAGGLHVKAPDERLKPFVDACYEYLTDLWWNVSSPKQIEAKDLVIYDKKAGKFECIPRRNPTPVAALSVGGSSWKAENDTYKDLSPEMKKSVDLFLKESGKSLWGVRKDKLPYEAPVCHPLIETFPARGKKDICSICGKDAVCEHVNQTSFPLFSSESATFSFNSQFGKPDLICWECAMLGKFAVHSAHYVVADSYTQVMQIYSNNLNALLDAHAHFGSSSGMRIFDSDKLAYRNFGPPGSFLEYAKLPYEIIWGFYIASFNLLSERDLSAEFAEEKLYNGIRLSESDIKALASMGVAMLSLEKKGQTFITKEVIDFHDSVYIFRLIDYISEALKGEDSQIGKNPDKFWKKLFDDFFLLQNPQKQYDPVNGLYRNRIFQKVFAKDSILLDVENFVFKKSLAEKNPYLHRILFFTTRYENAINGRDANSEGGKGMTEEQVKIASGLGAQIVIAARKVLMEGSQDREKLKPLKGDLFALRKTRRAVDFLEQLNRLQFRYGIVLNSEIVKGILVDENVKFEEFKAYCMISALNSYNSAMGFSDKDKQTEVGGKKSEI